MKTMVTLPYLLPFNFKALLQNYGMHKIGNLEKFVEDKMYRIIEFQGEVGEIIISNDEEKCELVVHIDFPNQDVIEDIIHRVRRMFDLDSDPEAIAYSLGKNIHIKDLLDKHPGIRTPSGWDPFEVAIGTILGQLVTIEMAISLLSQLIEIAGCESGLLLDGKPIKLFPTPEEILKADLTNLKTTNARKNTLKNLSQAIVNREISLDPDQDAGQFVKEAMKIKGIGRWTADYMALKVIRDTDSFPGTDLILARTLDLHPEEIVAQMSPWRGYVAALFWREYSSVLTKKKVKA